jgi:hypothetical protein
MAHACNPSYFTWEAEIRSIQAQGQPRQIVLETPSSKITSAKWTEPVAQVAEHLLCKCKALSSKSSPIKSKQKNVHNSVFFN